jgi:hypothetical protein
MNDFHRLRERRQRGSALFVSVMLLVLLGFVGLASLDTVTADRRVAGYQQRARVALDAAEAGLATAVGNLRNDLDELQDGGITAMSGYAPGLTSTTIGDLTSFVYGRPSFSSHPSLPQASDFLGTAGPCDELVVDLSNTATNSVWERSVFELRVLGQAPGGSQAGLQSSASACFAFGYGA